MTLDEEIDELAMDIERQILENERRLEAAPEFRFGRNLRRDAQDHIIELGDLEHENLSNG